MVDVIVGTEQLVANFVVRQFSIERIISRLTTPYETSPASNNFKLLTIDAEELDEFHTVLDEIVKAHHLSFAADISLEKLGDLLDINRRTGEVDESYRDRLRSAVSGIIGGGTQEQLREIVKEIMTGLTDADITIDDGYLTSTHGVGDPSHFAHFRVFLNTLGQTFTEGAFRSVFDELTRAKAAGVTMDSLGPRFLETQIVTEKFDIRLELVRFEDQLQTETFTYDLTIEAFAESQSELTEQELDLPLIQHLVDESFTDSLNLVFDPFTRMHANFTVV